MTQEDEEDGGGALLGRWQHLPLVTRNCHFIKVQSLGFVRFPVVSCVLINMLFSRNIYQGTQSYP